jgi:hypothetical protein
MPPAPDNPFRIHGVVTGEYFTDRATELASIRAAFREPGSKLLVYGPRRVGKTSALVRAIERHRATGGVAFVADLATATALADVASRILEAATMALGRKWKDAVADLIARVGLSLTLRPDPGTGMMMPSLDLSLRSAAADEQRDALARTLDAIDALARSRGTVIGVVLDEFQEIRRFGGDEAEWHLRGIVQHHAHASYVFAGSQAHVIERMLDKGAAFYKLADPLLFGPIDSDHLARWIDERLTGAGVQATGIGAVIHSAAGPRTRDIIQVARRCYDNCASRGRAQESDVSAAMDDVVADQAPLLEAQWARCTPLQQNVLRAVAADADGLTTAETSRRFALTSSGAATNAALALVEHGHLVRSESPTGYVFENPFFRRWVVHNALGDVPGASA